MSAERLTSPVRPTPDRPLTPPMPNRRPGAAVPIPAEATARHAKPERNLHSIVLIDVAGSAARDTQGQRRMRDDLYGIMADLTDENGFDLESLAFDDRGDGFRLIVPLDLIRPTRVVDTFVAGLTAGLREHRRHASESARLRIKASFDIGLVEPHRYSWTGDPLVRAARLIEARQVREALRSAPDTDLVAIVSEAMFEIVRHRLGYLAPDCFREIQVQFKEFEGPAWLLAPRSIGACPHCAYR
jgi:hypothetical protein